MTHDQPSPLQRSDRSERYLNPYVAGLLLGLFLFAAFAITGEGLGASGGMRSVVATTADAVSPATVDRHNFLARAARPAGHSALDQRIVWLLLGAAIGAAISGALAGRLRPEVHKRPGLPVWLRLTAAVVGGAFMGYGAQWGRGCTSGQALTGGALLSAGSWAFMFSVFGGAYALAYPLRRLWR